MWTHTRPLPVPPCPCSHRQNFTRWNLAVLQAVHSGIFSFILFYLILKVLVWLRQLTLWLTRELWVSVQRTLPYIIHPLPLAISCLNSCLCIWPPCRVFVCLLFPLPGVIFSVSSHDCMPYILRFLLRCSLEISSYNHPTLGNSPSLLSWPAFLCHSAHHLPCTSFVYCLPSQLEYQLHKSRDCFVCWCIPASQRGFQKSC